jgi:hypothetical protein
VPHSASLGPTPPPDAERVDVLRLQRVDAGDPDLDEVVEDRLEMAVALVDDANVGLDGPGSRDDPGQPGSEELAPGGWLIIMMPGSRRRRRGR